MKNKSQKGFTIVEVMIVLAIAGLILAVVFVAVPALQRSQRNGARKNDIALIRSQFTQTVANNGNNLPANDAFNLNSEELNNIGWGNGYFSGVNHVEASAADWSATATTKTHVEDGLLAGGIYYLRDGNNIVDGSSTPVGFPENHATGTCYDSTGSAVSPAPANEAACTGTAGNRWLKGTSHHYMGLVIGEDSALILGNKQCISTIIEVATPRTLERNDKFFAGNTVQQSAIIYTLEGDDNLYCENI